MKKKGFGLVSTSLSAVFAVLTFVALAFKFVLVSVTVANKSTSGSLTRGEWAEWLASGDDKLATYKVSRVLMIITLVVVAVVAVLAVVQLFVEHKALALATKVAAIVGIVLSVAFLICFFIGGAVKSESVTISGLTSGVTYFPSAGPILLSVFGLLASVFGLLTVKKAKKAK